MRVFFLLFASLLTCALSFGHCHAQGLLASNEPVMRHSATPPNRTVATTEKVLLTGKITSPAGPLPGAVVFLTSTKEMAVTDDAGEFKFLVPANAGPLQARVTYAGYADENMTLNASADESTVNLANARVIVMSRRNQMKKYLKTAHKQVKRDLKQLHRK